MPFAKLAKPSSKFSRIFCVVESLPVKATHLEEHENATDAENISRKGKNQQVGEKKSSPTDHLPSAVFLILIIGQLDTTHTTLAR
jgi:hypothetical protein